MSAWGTSLYSNDSTSDVRDTYTDFLREGLGNAEAYEKTLEAHHEFIGDEEEPLFWFALAETQWKAGRLMPEVKVKALEWIEKNGGMELWEESINGGAGWKKTLEKLKATLNLPMRSEKKFRKRIIKHQNPWNLNDVYAYKIHVRDHTGQDCEPKSVAAMEQMMYGKYILMQKIGEEKSRYSSELVMRVQVFEKLFDNLPSIEDAFETLKNCRLLPISNPLDQANRYKLRLQGRPDPFDMGEQLCIYNPVNMSMKMEQYYKEPSYPENELTYICTIQGPLNKQHGRIDGSSDCSVFWDDFYYGIGRQFSIWSNVEYDIIGDGTFEYPTLEEQLMKTEQYGDGNSMGTC